MYRYPNRLGLILQRKFYRRKGIFRRIAGASPMRNELRRGAGAAGNKQINNEHHKALFGIGNEGIRRNLEWLVDSGANVIIRMPLVRGYNDSFDAITGAIDYVQKLAKRGNIRRIDMLPYHQLGRKKYERLDMPYPITQDPTYSAEELDRLETFFTQFDFDIRLVRH